MIIEIEKKRLQNKSEIALGLMLEEIASAGRKLDGMRHYLGETCSEGKKYVFKIEVEVMAAEKFKLGDRVNHKKYGAGTVSKNCNGSSMKSFKPCLINASSPSPSKSSSCFCLAFSFN